jgi:nucleotide-binding universal stress UspA family protein
MAVRSKRPHPLPAATEGFTEPFRSLLLPMDLTAISDRVLRRVAHLPLAEGARIVLLHVVPQGLPIHAQRRAERDAKRVLADEARALAKALPLRATIEQVVRSGSPAVVIAECAAESMTELIVMGRGSGRALRDVFLGSTAERVIRQAQLPVLVVRLPARAPYKRPAMALDLDQAAHGVLASLLQVVPAPRPPVTVIHGLDIPHAGLVYPSLSVDDGEDFRARYRRKATTQIGQMISAALADAKIPPQDAPAITTEVRQGSPRTIVEQVTRKVDADLLVLGTHGRVGLAHLFLGTVAGDVLRTVTCDVLMVPPSQGRSTTK